MLQGLEIFLIIPIISLSGIGSINTDVGPILVISEFLQNYPRLFGLPLILGLYIVLVTGQGFFHRKIFFQNIKICQRFMVHLKLQIYRSILEANWEFFINKRKSDLVNLLTNQLGRVNAGLGTFLLLVSTVIFSVIQVGLALWLSVKITILIVVCGLALIVFTGKYTKKAKRLGFQAADLSQGHLANITDQLNGIKEIKSNNLEESRLNWFHSLLEEIQDRQCDYAYLNMTSQLVYKISSAILIAVFVFVSIRVFNTPLDQLILVIVIISRLWPRFMTVQSNMEQIATNIQAFKELAQLEKECKEVRDLAVKDNRPQGSKLTRIEKVMECRNIFFRYNRKEQIYALQDITLQIPSQCTTAIVGPSGAGKSTLIDILMGLMQPEKGCVLIDGVPLRSNNIFSLRRLISYVPQDPFLFNGSIRENLLLVEPEASEEEIWNALEFSASAEFVKKLPQGLETVVGDRGVRLSGGERQRLVLARAILRKPLILVLDEATSSLDTQNEAKIQEVLNRLKGTMTIIVIAHRLSTVRNADQVIVLDHGKVVQKGGFHQLAGEKKGLFSSLLINQTGLSS
ncbi:MAG: ABC transporter ATP-binding protein [Thermincola sp.]|nr:ABC transporter ATP-binding protein [Thermincola sp.]